MLCAPTAGRGPIAAPPRPHGLGTPTGPVLNGAAPCPRSPGVPFVMQHGLGPPPGTCPHHSPPVSPSPRDPQDVSTFQCLHVPQVPRCPLCMYVAGLRSPLQPLCVPWVPGCPFGNAAWPWVPQDRSPLQCPRSPWPQLPSRSPLGPLRAPQIPRFLWLWVLIEHVPITAPPCPPGVPLACSVALDPTGNIPIAAPSCSSGPHKHQVYPGRVPITAPL